MADGRDLERARDLIERIDAEAEREAARLIAEAREKAREIIRGARAQARTKLQREVAELRRAGKQELARMGAKIDTERRQVQQARYAAAKDEGLALLDDALSELWATPGARGVWCAKVLDEAKARLMPGLWTVVHPPGWPEPERESFIAALAAHTGTEAHGEEDPALFAGLIIRADTACMDGSLEALTRDRARLGALFLREMSARLEGRGA
jgi:vacuolar-type H+-ATPase subunit H